MSRFEFYGEKVVESVWETAAKTLIGIAKANHKLRFKPSLKSWAATLSNLSPEYTGEFVCKTLCWYVDHVKDEYVPRAYTAAAFAFKFSEIVDAMQLTEENQVEDEWSRRTAERLAVSYRYPVEVESKLPQIVYKTRKNWEKFWDTCVSFFEKLSDREKQFLDTVKKSQGQFFSESWMIRLSTTHGFRDHYSGPVMKLAFSIDSQAFKESVWKDWSFHWCGNPNAFDKLLQKLIKHK